MNIILFLDTEVSQSSSCVLPKHDYRMRHLLQVLGAQESRSYRAGIINGSQGSIIVDAITEQAVRFHFCPSDCNPIPLLPIKLIIGHPRPLATKRLVSDLSTLGVQEINFFIGDNSEKSYLKSHIWKDNTLTRMLIKGAEQAGSTIMPALHRYATLEEALQHIHAHQTCSLCRLQYLDITTPQLAHATAKKLSAPSNTTHQDHITSIIAIGSERGWSARELSMLHRYYYQPWTLGVRILRTATATLAATVLATQRYLVSKE